MMTTSDTSIVPQSAPSLAASPDCAQPTPSLNSVFSYHVGEVIDWEMDETGRVGESTWTTDCIFSSLQMKVLGIPPHAAAVMSLVPIIHVAWAEGSLRPAQRKQILSRLEAFVPAHSTARRLLDQWLSARPDDNLFRIWNDYIAALKWAVPADAFERLGDELMFRASLTAEALRPCFGLGASSEHYLTAAENIAQAFDAR